MPPAGKHETDKMGGKMNKSIIIYNSPIELGTRASLILTALSKKLSLDQLVILDYALLYSKEIGGPDNLHPALPNHFAEIAHRREHLPNSLQLFVKRGLIDLLIEDSGYYYTCNSQTLEFTSCLQSHYYRKSWIRLNWIKDNYTRIIQTSLQSLEAQNL